MRAALKLIRSRAPGPRDRWRDARRRRIVRSDPQPRGAGQPARRHSEPVGHANLDAANIGFTLLKAAADGLPIGPILLGMSKPVHVLVPSVTARGIINLSALAVLEAQAAEAPAQGAAEAVAKGVAAV